jgi:GcrA cell cycle regulator
MGYPRIPEPSIWTDDRVAVLRRLWADGDTAREIASAIGERVTRNMVIGKARRLGLKPRPSPIKGKS